MTFAADTSLRRARAYVLRLPHVHDRRMLVLEALSWCDEGWASPEEVRLRSICVAASAGDRHYDLHRAEPRRRRPGLSSTWSAKQLGMREFDAPTTAREPGIASTYAVLRRLPASRSGIATFVGEDLDAEDLLLNVSARRTSACVTPSAAGGPRLPAGHSTIASIIVTSCGTCDRPPCSLPPSPHTFQGPTDAAYPADRVSLLTTAHNPAGPASSSAPEPVLVEDRYAELLGLVGLGAGVLADHDVVGLLRHRARALPPRR